jgi:DNA polymerase III subunit gamma/tau
MSDPAYRVLARKYRPVDFDGLIGQDVLVRTLSNAIAAGRLAQAYVLTGVRGVGKTTTARILARAFNCIGPDGTGGPTVKPCGVCEHCRAIADDRHVDVVEMDAASNNSVDNIREIVDSSRYRPASARYKIYILDEVHMLSNAAFNALLKTLEEPPPHLKFIFATTEIRKVPVTVLSRCQRFDLRRVEAAELAAHFAQIAAQEGIEVVPAALELVARAADGSVRDGLSILDQAIALADGTVQEAQVRDMLGLADRGVIFDLAEALIAGNAGEAIAVSERMHAVGADAAVVLNDLLELVHWLTRLKIDPSAANDALMPEAERERGAQMADPLSLPVLARLWQALLKGVGELNQAPTANLALEMLLIRVAYMANLPSPADLVRQLQDGGGVVAGGATAAAIPRPSSVPPTPRAVGAMPVGEIVVRNALPTGPPPAPPRRQLNAQPPLPPDDEPPLGFMDDAPPFEDEIIVGAQSDAAVDEHSIPQNFRDFVRYLELRKIEPLLTARLRNQVRPVAFAKGEVTIALVQGGDRELAGGIRVLLERLCGGQWRVNIAPSSDAQTVAELAEATKQADHAAALEHPLVQAALEAFPGATVRDVRTRDIVIEADDAIIPPVDEDC